MFYKAKMYVCTYNSNLHAGGVRVKGEPNVCVRGGLVCKNIFKEIMNANVYVCVYVYIMLK